MKALSNVCEPGWFGWVGTLLYAKRVHGSEKLLDEFKDKIRSIPNVDYKRAAATSLAWMLESLNKIRNAYDQENLYNTITSALYFRNLVGEFVALMNKEHYTSHVFRSLKEAKDFNKLPIRFFELMTILGTSNNLEKIYRSANELWANCLSLAKANNVNIEPYSSFGDIKFEI